MVADLLSRETKEWNKALVDKLLPKVSSHILSIHPSLKGDPDSIWTQQESEEYSVKSGYFSAQTTKIQSTLGLLNSDSWNWQRYIWSPTLIPKIKFFLWKCAQTFFQHGKTYVKGLLANTLCTRCGADESIQHILFHCSFSKEVWDMCPWSTQLDLNSCSSFKVALQTSVSKINLPPTGTSSNLFWIYWNIWVSRNQLIFQNRNTAAMETITKALTSLKEWEEAQLMMRYKATSNSTDDLVLYRCRMEFRNEICRPGLDLHRSIGFGLS